MLLAAPLLTPSLVAPARYYLGIDTGTQSTKAIVYDATQRLIVGRGAVSHGLNPTSVVGRAEQDPEVWVDAMWRAGRAALDEMESSVGAEARSLVSGIGVSGYASQGSNPSLAICHSHVQASLWTASSTGWWRWTPSTR